VLAKADDTPLARLLAHQARPIVAAQKKAPEENGVRPDSGAELCVTLRIGLRGRVTERNAITDRTAEVLESPSVVNWGARASRLRRKVGGRSGHAPSAEPERPVLRVDAIRRAAIFPLPAPIPPNADRLAPQFLTSFHLRREGLAMVNRRWLGRAWQRPGGALVSGG
jgi:hypothetical protein